MSPFSRKKVYGGECPDCKCQVSAHRLEKHRLARIFHKKGQPSSKSLIE
jgi:hypothetical protein